MCGIAFVFSKKDLNLTKQHSKHFIEHLKNRGPDSQNFYQEKNFSLISTRLAIIDQKERSNQPLHSICKNYIIIFNGMIYNYMELKKKYLNNVKFMTDSDTEVILEMYKKYNKKCLDLLDGMYAFIIYDKIKNIFFIGRDKTGIKPLYYISNDEYILFSSNFKSLLNYSKKEISKDGLFEFLNFGYTLEPNTIVKGIKMFPNSSYGEIKEKTLSIHKFKDEKNIYFKKSYKKKHDYDKTVSKLSEIIKKHTLADSPICLFLSSGFDSNIIASICKKMNINIQTITLGFEKYEGTLDDETKYVKNLNKIYGFKNTIINIKNEELKALKTKFEKNIDHPSTDGFNTFLITHYAKKLGFKVAISGLGGDEIFNSYGNLRKIKFVKKLNKTLEFLFLRKFFEKILKIFNFTPKIKNIIQYEIDDFSLYLFARSLFLKSEIKPIADKELNIDLDKFNYNRKFCEYKNIKEKLKEKKVSYFESDIYMKNQLLKDSDWASMANSVELRVPLANSVTIDYFSHFLNFKKTREELLKKINIDVYNQIKKKPKTGFSVPIDIFFEKQKHNPYRVYSLTIIKKFLKDSLNANN